MPPAKRASSSSSKSSSPKSSTARSTAAAGSTAAKRSTSTKGSTSAKRSSAAKGAGTTKRSTGAKRSSTARSSKARTASNRSGTGGGAAAREADEGLDAVAARLRKLNERIIDAGRDAGDSTLTSYERALKAIANGIEKGPGSSDIDWISNLATAQAKFIRDVTRTWTSAARDLIK